MALRWSLWGSLALVACGGDPQTSAPGTTAPVELSYADVAPIIERYCERCHGDPVDHFAPFPLTSWELMQEEYPADSGVPVWQAMEGSIERDFMPLVDLVLEPPVEPLPAADKARLLEWLRAGAPLGAP